LISRYRILLLGVIGNTVYVWRSARNA